MGQLLKLSNLKWSLLLLLPASLFVACDNDEDFPEPNYDVPFPTANFAFEANESNTLEVSFTSTSADADSYVWDFGDGVGTSNEANPTYTYAGSGTFEVSLTVTNARGVISNSKEITVVEPSKFGDNLVLDPSMDNDGSWTYKQLWNGDDNKVEHGFTEGSFKWIGAEGTAYSNAILYQEIAVTPGQKYYFNMLVKSESGTTNSWLEVYFGKDPVDGEDYGSGGAQAFIKSFGDGENCGLDAFEGDVYAIAAGGCPIPEASKLGPDGSVTFSEADLTDNGTIILAIKAGNWDGNFGSGIMVDDVELRPVVE